MPSELIKMHKEAYDAIVQFYDIAEVLIDSVEESEGDPVEQFHFIEPMVEEIERSADFLTARYREFAQSGEQPSIFTKREIEVALKNIYSILHKCKQVANK